MLHTSELVCVALYSFVQLSFGKPIQNSERIISASSEIDYRNKYYDLKTGPNSDSGNIQFRNPVVYLTNRIYFPDDFRLQHDRISNNTSFRSVKLLETAEGTGADINLINQDALSMLPDKLTNLDATQRVYDSDKTSIIFESSSEEEEPRNKSQVQWQKYRNKLEIQKLRSKLAQLEKLRTEREDLYRFAYWSLFQTPSYNRAGCPVGSRMDHIGRCLKMNGVQIANARYQL